MPDKPSRVPSVIAGPTPLPELSLGTLYTLVNSNDRLYQQQFTSVREASVLALDAAKEAVMKSEGTANERFHAGNQFRQQIESERANYVPRTEHKRDIEEVQKDVKKLE